MVLNSLDVFSIVDYLNKIGDGLDRAFKRHASAERELPTLKRLWTAHFQPSIINRSRGDRNAFISLVDIDHARCPTNLPYNGEGPTWLNLYSITHVLRGERLSRSSMNDHNIIAYLMFLIQHRSWTPQILIISPIQYLVSITTRHSMQFSMCLNLDHPRESYTFLQVLIGLLFFDNDAVGFGADSNLGAVEGSFDATLWNELQLQLLERS